MKVHYVEPLHGYHEPDEWNPLYCGLEPLSPKTTHDWNFVTCEKCLAIKAERDESREHHGPCMFRALAEDLKRQLEREIEASATICQEVAKVYCHITNGRISKANTRAEDVIAVHDDCCSEED